MDNVKFGIYACEGNDYFVMLEEFDSESAKKDTEELEKRVMKLLPAQPEQLFVSGTFTDTQYRLGIYIMRQSHLVDDGHITNQFYVNMRCAQLVDGIYARGGEMNAATEG